jgi:hypothetical protein
MTSALSDSGILDDVVASLREAVICQRPISPAAAAYLLNSINYLRHPKRKDEPAPGSEEHAEYLRLIRSVQRRHKPDFTDPAWQEKLAAEILNECFDKLAPTHEVQQYWRCEHHPSALQNYQEELEVCAYGCHLNELRWWENGTCKPQNY